MNLYNMIYGVNENADYLLKELGFSESDIPRFRDCYIKNNAIIIVTQTGGGNRDFYEKTKHDFLNENPLNHYDGPWNDDLRKNKYYMVDYDDSSDYTYAHFVFKIPNISFYEVKTEESFNMNCENLKYDTLFIFNAEFDINIEAILLDSIGIWHCILFKNNARSLSIVISHIETIKTTVDLWKAIKKKIITYYSFIVPILEEGK